MKQIFKQDFNKTLKDKEFSWDFEVEQQGLYGIEITASAKSRRQNIFSFRSFFQDDDLAVKIDDVSFPKQSGKRGLFDSEAAWNGSNLMGKKKTNFFLIQLSPGNHKLNFSIDQHPKLHTIKICQIKGGEVSYLPEDNYPPQDANRRQWLTIILCQLGLDSVKINASAKQGKKFLLFKRDDSDLKLIINGQIQKNRELKSHKYWYWCGRTLKDQSKIFKKEFNLKPDLHYLELWADRTPRVKEISINLEQIKERRVKRIPTVNDPKWTGYFGDDTEQIILARMIFGEARNQIEKAKIAVAWSAKNRVIDSRWGNNYHKVILKDKQYSAFNKDDVNLSHIQDPFLDKTQKNAWYECYKIAGKIIEGKLKDPTNGANHYYSDDINPPFWTKVKEAKFKIKIDNLVFYNLEKSRSGGRIRLSSLILIFLGFILLSGVVFVSIFKIKNQPIFDKYFFIHPIWNEVAVIYFNQDGKFIDLEQLTNDGYRKSHLDVFSESGKLGYFQDLHKRGENLDYQDEQARKEYYNNYTALMIMNEGASPFEIYRGDSHISNWGWFSYYQVVLYESCGSGCQSWKHININTKEIEEQGVTFFETN